MTPVARDRWCRRDIFRQIAIYNRYQIDGCLHIFHHLFWTLPALRFDSLPFSRERFFTSFSHYIFRYFHAPPLCFCLRRHATPPCRCQRESASFIFFSFFSTDFLSAICRTRRYRRWAGFIEVDSYVMIFSDWFSFSLSLLIQMPIFIEMTLQTEREVCLKNTDWRFLPRSCLFAAFLSGCRCHIAAAFRLPPMPRRRCLAVTPLFHVFFFFFFFFWEPLFSFQDEDICRCRFRRQIWYIFPLERWLLAKIIFLSFLAAAFPSLFLHAMPSVMRFFTPRYCRRI